MALRNLVCAILVGVIALPATAFSQAAPSAECWRNWAAAQPPNASVRVTLTNGTKVTGELSGVFERTLQVAVKTRLTEKVVAVRYDDVASIEPRRRGLSPGVKFLIGAGAVGAVVVAGFLVMLSQLD